MKKAISFCLFDSPEFSVEKHLNPFRHWLHTKAEQWPGDVLLSTESVVANLIDIPDFVKVTRRDDYPQDWSRHLWRYQIPLNYDWVLFQGTDTPDRAHLNKMQTIGADLDFPIVSFLHGRPPKFHSVSGSCWMAKRALESFQNYINYFIHDSDADINKFNYDEQLLHDWFSSTHFPIAYLTSCPVYNFKAQAWLKERLYSGPDTLILSRP